MFQILLEMDAWPYCKTIYHTVQNLPKLLKKPVFFYVCGSVHIGNICLIKVQLEVHYIIYLFLDNVSSTYKAVPNQYLLQRNKTKPYKTYGCTLQLCS
jgi:hypothetical protein